MLREAKERYKERKKSSRPSPPTSGHIYVLTHTQIHPFNQTWSSLTFLCLPIQPCPAVLLSIFQSHLHSQLLQAAMLVDFPMSTGNPSDIFRGIHLLHPAPSNNIMFLGSVCLYRVQEVGRQESPSAHGGPQNQDQQNALPIQALLTCVSSTSFYCECFWDRQPFNCLIFLGNLLCEHVCCK